MPFERSENDLPAAPFFLVPFIGGLVAAWFWRNLNRSVAISLVDACWTSLFGLLTAAIILREGAVCLVMAFPALYGMIYAAEAPPTEKNRVAAQMRVSILPCLGH